MAEKIPGKTLAESLGLEIPENAPGGQPLAYLVREGGQRTTSQRQIANELTIEGFHDTDAYR